MDLSEHLAVIWAKRFVVLGIALVVAVATFAWRVSAPAEYVASSTVQVRVPQTGDPAGQSAYYAESAFGLVTSRSVVREALAAAGRTDELESAVGSVEATLIGGPGFLSVSGFGGTPEEAVRLTDALVVALSRQIADEQAEDQAAERQAVVDAIAEVDDELQALGPTDSRLGSLQAERAALVGSLDALADNTLQWRIAVVEAAEAPTSASAPRPVRDALLGFLIALILLAEGAVLLRAGRGALRTRDPARDVSEVLGVPAVALHPTDGPGSLAALLAPVGNGPTVTIARIGRGRDARSGTLLAELLAQRREDVLIVDGTPAQASVHAELGVALRPGLTDLPENADAVARRLGDLPVSRRLRVLTAGVGEPVPGVLGRVVAGAAQDRVVVVLCAERFDDLIMALSELDGPVVLVVDAAGATRAELRSELAGLQGLGVDLVGAAVEVARDWPPAWAGRLGRRTPAAGGTDSGSDTDAKGSGTGPGSSPRDRSGSAAARTTAATRTTAAKSAAKSAAKPDAKSAAESAARSATRSPAGTTSKTTTKTTGRPAAKTSAKKPASTDQGGSREGGSGQGGSGQGGSGSGRDAGRGETGSGGSVASDEPADSPAT